MAAGRDHPAQLSRIPNRLCTYPQIRGYHRIDQGDICKASVYGYLYALIPYAAVFGGTQYGRRSGSHTGDRPFRQGGINVVRSRGHRKDGGFVQPLGGGAAGAVAAEYDAASCSHSFHELRRPDGVLIGGGNGHIEDAQLRLQQTVPCKIGHDRAADLKGIRHKQYPVYTHGLRRQRDPLDDIDLFPIVYGGGIGYQSPYVLAGRRICYDADCRHEPPPFL